MAVSLPGSSDGCKTQIKSHAYFLIHLILASTFSRATSTAIIAMHTGGFARTTLLLLARVLARAVKFLLLALM